MKPKQRPQKQLSPEQFNKLKADWYKKAAKSGFEDIEQDEFRLKTWTNRNTLKIFRVYNDDPVAGEMLWRSIAEYYQMAADFLARYRFDTEIDKVIWEYHANGLTLQEIVATLKKAKIPRTGRTMVWKTTRRLKIKMYDLYLATKKYDEKP